jgi:hypothetical protein
MTTQDDIVGTIDLTRWEQERLVNLVAREARHRSARGKAKQHWKDLADKLSKGITVPTGWAR